MYLLRCAGLPDNVNKYNIAGTYLITNILFIVVIIITVYAMHPCKL